MPLLEVKNVTKRFGGITALRAVTMYIEEKSIVGLIGPNGSEVRLLRWEWEGLFK